MMAKERVVITGIGSVSPLGSDTPTFWKNCLGGKSGVKNISDMFYIPEYMSQIAGVTQIPFEKSASSIQERNLLFAKMAVNEALVDSKLLESSFLKNRCGVFLSTAIAEIALMEWSFNQYKQGKGHIDLVPPSSPYYSGSFFFNNLAKSIAALFGFTGGAVTIATGCTGGNDALGYALQMIRNGRVDVAIAGAAEAPITPLVVAAFSKIGATSKRNHNPEAASRPFDKDRDGFVLAEGSAMLVLESLTHAEARGAQIYAEIAGFGSVNNCFHMTDIPQNGESIAKACMLSLKDADLKAHEIDYINAHGSSTPQNDIAETNAFYAIFGPRAKEIPVTSIKSQLGHALSAANVLELITAVLTLRDNLIPRTINLENQDPSCPLRVVKDKPLESRVSAILKTSSGFSGIHSSLILKRI